MVYSSLFFVPQEDGNIQKLELHLVELRLNESSYGIRGGVNYTITLTAINCGGPPLSTSVVSKPVMVDTTGPVGGEIFNTSLFNFYLSFKFKLFIALNLQQIQVQGLMRNLVLHGSLSLIMNQM